MRGKLMELIGWCYEVTNRTEYETFISYNGFRHEDITVGYYNIPYCGERDTTYIFLGERITLKKLDYAIERLKELLNEN